MATKARHRDGRPCVLRSATDVAAHARTLLPRSFTCLDLGMTLIALDEEDRRMKFGRDKIEHQGVQQAREAWTAGSHAFVWQAPGQASSRHRRDVQPNAKRDLGGRL